MHKSTRHECIKQGISPIAEYSRSLLSPFNRSLPLSLSPLDETKPRDTFARVCIQFRAPIELLRRFDSQRRLEPILLRETGFDNLSDDVRFVAPGCAPRVISSGKARRALSSGVKAYNFQPFSVDLALPNRGRRTTKRDNAFLCTLPERQSSNL